MVKRIIMYGVFAFWSIYIGYSMYGFMFEHSSAPPLPAWSIPGATYVLLSDRKISIGKDGVELDGEEKEK